MGVTRKFYREEHDFQPKCSFFLFCTKWRKTPIFATFRLCLLMGGFGTDESICVQPGRGALSVTHIHNDLNLTTLEAYCSYAIIHVNFSPAFSLRFSQLTLIHFLKFAFIWFAICLCGYILSCCWL